MDLRGEPRRGSLGQPAACVLEVVPGAHPVAPMHGRPRTRDEGQRARRRSLELGFLQHVGRRGRQGLGGVPASFGGREQGSLGECDGGDVRATRKCCRRVCLREDLVCRDGLALEKLPDTEKHQGGRPPRAALGQSGESPRGVVPHVVLPCAAHRCSQDRRPRLDRRSPVGHDRVTGRTLGDGRHGFRLLRASEQGVQERTGDRDRRVALEQLDVQPGEPALQDRATAGVEERASGLLEDRREPIAIARRPRVVAGALEIAASGGPVGGIGCDRLRAPRFPAPQLRGQRLTKHRLEPVHVRPTRPEADHEQV